MKVAPAVVPSRYEKVPLVKQELSEPKVRQSSASVPTSALASFTFPDGSTYNGPLKNGLPHGKGIRKWPSGDVQYKGQFELGKFNGYGIFKKGGYTYEGVFREGYKHGTGVATFSNGSSYNGEFVNNKRHGKGVFKYANGDEYSGDWKDNKKHGLGTYTWSSGRKYLGNWKGDLNHGVGIETDANGNFVHADWFKDDDPQSRNNLEAFQFEESCYVSNTLWNCAHHIGNERTLIYLYHSIYRFARTSMPLVKCSMERNVSICFTSAVWDAGWNGRKRVPFAAPVYSRLVMMRTTIISRKKPHTPWLENVQFFHFAFFLSSQSVSNAVAVMPFFVLLYIYTFSLD
jgi:hypothetical protein